MELYPNIVLTQVSDVEFISMCNKFHSLPDIPKKVIHVTENSINYQGLFKPITRKIRRAEFSYGFDINNVAEADLISRTFVETELPEFNCYTPDRLDAQLKHCPDDIMKYDLLAEEIVKIISQKNENCRKSQMFQMVYDNLERNQSIDFFKEGFLTLNEAEIELIEDLRLAAFAYTTFVYIKFIEKRIEEVQRLISNKEELVFHSSCRVDTLSPDVELKYKNLKEAFINEKAYNQAMNALRVVKYPVISDDNLYLLGPRMKGAFTAWLGVLKERGKIRSVPSSTMAKLLNKSIKGLNLYEDGSTLNDDTTTAYKKYHLPFLSLIA